MIRNAQEKIVHCPLSSVTLVSLPTTDAALASHKNNQFNL